MLAVAAASEAFELRESLADTPILTMGALTDAELDVALGARSEIAVWREGFLETVAERGAGARASGRGSTSSTTPAWAVSASARPANVERLARARRRGPPASSSPASGPTSRPPTSATPASSTSSSRASPSSSTAPARPTAPGLVVHAANSAATLREPRSHFDMVRCGIAVYGLDPFGADPRRARLEPAMGLSSYVAAIKRFEPGDSAGYGRTWIAERDDLRRRRPDRLRRRRPPRPQQPPRGPDRRARATRVVGTISMDNLTVDLGPEPVGRPRARRSSCSAPPARTQVQRRGVGARTLDTINYEITCGVSPRVPRIVRR